MKYFQLLLGFMLISSIGFGQVYKPEFQKIISAYEAEYKEHNLYVQFARITLEDDYNRLEKDSKYSLKKFLDKYASIIGNNPFVIEARDRLELLEFLDSYEIIKVIDNVDVYIEFVKKYENSIFKNDGRINHINKLVQSKKNLTFENDYFLAKVSSSEKSYSEFISKYSDRKTDVRLQEVMILKQKLLSSQQSTQFKEEGETLEEARKGAIDQLNEFLQKPENKAIELIDVDHQYSKLSTLNRIEYSIIVTYKKL